MTLVTTRRRPADEDEQPDTPRPPYVKEPETDVPDGDEQGGNVVTPVQAFSGTLLSFA